MWYKSHVKNNPFMYMKTTVLPLPKCADVILMIPWQFIVHSISWSPFLATTFL